MENKMIFLKHYATNLIKKVFNKTSFSGVTYLPVNKKQLAQYNLTRVNGPQPLLCYAPFKNIYFGHQGKTVACCYNRQHVLGIYPEKSIREIWFGEEANRLRNYIQHNDFSSGCYNCNNYFKAGNFDGIKAKMYDQNKLNRNKFPSVMEFEISNSCNLECIMCSGEFSSSIRKNRENKPPVTEPYDTAFVKQLEEFIPWLDEAKFYGGEPFLVNIYYEIWERITALNPKCRITIQTNATILNKKVKELLNKGIFHLNISLDSLQKETFERIRVNAKFETVMENIKYFQQYSKNKNTFFGISACAIRQNWKELPDFIDFCNKLDVPVYFHTVWFPSHCSLWNLDSVSLEEIYGFLSGCYFPQENDIQKKNRNHYMDTVKLVSSWLQNTKKREDEKRQTARNGNLPDAKRVLFSRVEGYIRQLPDITEGDKNKKVAFYLSKINNVINQLPAGYPLEKALEHVNDDQIEMLVSELEVNSEEKILQQALAYANG